MSSFSLHNFVLPVMEYHFSLTGSSQPPPDILLEISAAFQPVWRAWQTSEETLDRYLANHLLALSAVHHPPSVIDPWLDAIACETDTKALAGWTFWLPETPSERQCLLHTWYSHLDPDDPQRYEVARLAQKQLMDGYSSLHYGRCLAGIRSLTIWPELSTAMQCYARQHLYSDVPMERGLALSLFIALDSPQEEAFLLELFTRESHPIPLLSFAQWLPKSPDARQAALQIWKRHAKSPDLAVRMISAHAIATLALAEVQRSLQNQCMEQPSSSDDDFSAGLRDLLSPWLAEVNFEHAAENLSKVIGEAEVWLNCQLPFKDPENPLFSGDKPQNDERDIPETWFLPPSSFMRSRPEPPRDVHSLSPFRSGPESGFSL